MPVPGTRLLIKTLLHTFSLNFLVLQGPYHPGNSNPFCGAQGVWIFSVTAHCDNERCKRCIDPAEVEIMKSYLKTLGTCMVSKHLKMYRRFDGLSAASLGRL